jgi:hypothetical protein
MLAPVVTFISPEHNSTVAGLVPVVVEIQDESAIDDIGLFINDIRVAQWSEQGRYTYEWDTSQFKNGDYRLTLQAIDEYANQGEAYILVSVNQAAESTPLTQSDPKARQKP